LRSARIFYLQIIFFLLAFCIGILVLAKLVSDLKDSSNDLSESILARSEAVFAKMRMTGFRRPGPGDTIIFDPRDKSGGQFQVSAIGCFFGSKPQWVVPAEAAFPAFAEPVKGAPGVTVLSSSRRIYTAKVEDGRTLAILFETPRYRSDWRQTMGISTFLVLLVILGMVLASYTLRRFVSPQYERAAEAPRRDLGPMDAVVMMKKTVSELRDRNKELEEKLRREKTKAKGAASVLESLSSGLDAGFLRFDPSGRLVAMNPIANRLLGLPVLLTLGDPHNKIFCGRPALRTLVDEAISAKRILTAEEVEGFQGKLLQVITLPVLDDLGHFEGVLLIILDRSSYYAMERAVREKEALARLGEVAAGVAHEVRNGLNVLSGELRLLKQETGGASEGRIVRIGGEIGQMEKVVRDLLYFSKPLTLQKDPISLREFSEDLVASAKSLFPSVRFTLETEEAQFSADQDSLFRALLNLASNAAEAAGEGGEVLLSAMAEGESAVFRVEDSGEGVSAEAEKDLFSLFATHKKGGTGLGLPISRKIAREHGGELYLTKSVKLGGACFELKVPK